MKKVARNKLDSMEFSPQVLFPGEEGEVAARAPIPTIRVKANRWFTPSRLAKDGRTPIFPAKQLVATWFGSNRELRSVLHEHPEAELAVPMDRETQNLYYKSTIGVLAVGKAVLPVRLETLNAGESMDFSVQHALVDTRENRGETQVKFR